MIQLGSKTAKSGFKNDGRKRRYIARSKIELYYDRPDLSEKASVKIVDGWWLGTNYDRDGITKIIQLAAEVAGIKVGTELKIFIEKP